jgi:hypothetical protein
MVPDLHKGVDVLSTAQLVGLSREVPRYLWTTC